MDIRLTRSWIALLIIIGCVLIINSNIYQCPFVFDDIPGIQENVKIRTLSNYWSLDDLLTPRAIVDLTFALNYHFGKLNVFGYHLVNVVIHIINGFLVYFLSLAIFRQVLIPPKQKLNDLSGGISNARVSDPEANRPQPGTHQLPLANRQSTIQFMSLFASLIFIAHPIQTQAVTYTVQRCTSMAALFFLSSVLFYLKARLIQQGAEDGARKSERGQEKGDQELKRIETKPIPFFAISVICGMLAFLSKQNTASLPGIILLSEYLLIDRTWSGWKKKIPWFFVVLVLWGLFVLYVADFFGGGPVNKGFLENVSMFSQETEHVSRWSYLCTQFNVLVIYMRLLFLPIGQNLDHMYPFMTDFFTGYTPIAFFLLLGVFFIGIINHRKRPIVTFGIFWFFITLSVESSFIPIKDALVEHRLYLPMFGFALLISYLLFVVLPMRTYWQIISCIVIIVLLGSATYMRNRVWRDSVILYGDVISKNPLNARGHYNLGMEFEKRGEFEDAISHYVKALQLKPERAYIHTSLANVLLMKDRTETAIKHFSIALKLDPNYVKAHIGLGDALLREGRVKDAVNRYMYSLRIDPDCAKAHNNLASVLSRQGHFQEAVNHYLEAIRLEPNTAAAHNGLGITLAKAGKLKEAIVSFRRARQINPEDVRIRQNLERALQLYSQSENSERVLKRPGK